MSRKKRILFICRANSARSQMAEAYLNTLWGETYEAESAGIYEAPIHPLVVEALSQDGIDISQKRSKTIDELLKNGAEFDLVIAVCSKKTAEMCPAFQNAPVQVFWDIPDPIVAGVSEERLLKNIITARDTIKEKIKEMVLEDYLKRRPRGVWLPG